MTVVYRGTQRRAKGGRQGAHAYTASLPVAIVYSAVPAGEWGTPPARFLKTSTVHAIDLDCRTALDMAHGETYLGFNDVLAYLDYGKPGGLTHAEARRILNYLHNRLMGKVKVGGQFQYKVYEPGGEEREGSLIEMFYGTTDVSAFRDDYWDGVEGDSEEDVFSIAEMLQADAFVFVDSPTFQKVAQRIGHDCIIYTDLFGGQYAAEDLKLGIDFEDLIEIGISWDLDHDRVNTITSYRPLSLRPIRVLWARPTRAVLRTVPLEGLFAP